MNFNRKVVFDGLRTALKPKAGFNDQQVTSIAAIVDEFEKRKLPDVRWLAYILATVWHEARFISQPEIGRGKGKKYGKPHKQTGKVYYGRGFSQITWYDNYLKFEKTLGQPLTTNPDLALIVPVAVQILFEGMMTGVTAKDSFTKYQLHDFFNDKKDDPIGARRIINGVDKNKLIAGYHGKILSVLKEAVQVEARQVEFDNPNPPKPEPQPSNAGKAVGGGAAVVVGGGAAAVAAGWPWERVLLGVGIVAALVVIGFIVFKLRKQS
jgi:hypothetical protein